MTAGAIALIVLAIFVLIIAMAGVRIVPQARAGVVERLGRYTRTLDAGLTLIVPFIDRVKPLIDLREQVVAFPPQPVITEDNLVVGIDTVIYFTVTDPKAATYEIANPLQAIEQLTVTTLRNVIGGLTLEETLTSRDNINSQLRVVLDEATGKWGIRVNRVELKSVEPPRTVQEAMEKQMRAERDRRAAILTAEGTKQSQILTAEGEKQAAVLKAEGARTAAILRAEGESKAIDTVFQAIHDGAARPAAALLPVPADAAPARAGLGEQGLRHPVRVLPGAREHRRRAGAAAAAATTASPPRKPRPHGAATARADEAARAAAADTEAAARAAPRPRRPPRARRGRAGWAMAAPGPGAFRRRPEHETRRRRGTSGAAAAAAVYRLSRRVRLPRREAPGHARRRPPARRADRGRHQRPRCARSASRCSRPTSTSRSSSSSRRRVKERCLGRRGAAPAQPGPAGRQDRQRGADRADGRPVGGADVLAAPADGRS